MKPIETRYPHGITLNKDEEEQLIICRLNGFEIKGIFLKGLEVVLKTCPKPSGEMIEKVKGLIQ